MHRTEKVAFSEPLTSTSWGANTGGLAVLSVSRAKMISLAWKSKEDATRRKPWLR